MVEMPDAVLLAQIGRLSADLAAGAGRILSGHFGKQVDIWYKDENQSDPVTSADIECQDYLTNIINVRFPDHGVLGEENPVGTDLIAPDFVWAIDPLDGTSNFIGGIPIFACSIGVLYRGMPIAGAIYIPWPGSGEGRVYYAWKGGGAFLNNILVNNLNDRTVRGNLATFPSSFRENYAICKSVEGKVGDSRTLGSIAYELAMVSSGELVYAMIGKSSLWDVSAGVAIVCEAGGDVRIGKETTNQGPLPVCFGWERLTTFVDDWLADKIKMAELRKWSAPLIIGRSDRVSELTRAIRKRTVIS